MSLLGADGLANVAATCHENTNMLVQLLTGIDGVEPVFDAPAFHERVLRLPMNAGQALAALAEQGMLGGYDLSREYPELGDAILVCATEKRTGEEMQQYAAALSPVLAS
jgi:glycine dehydrogenase subunit 1